LAGVLLFVEKIRQRAALFWFGLQDVGILQILYSQAVIQRTNVDFPAFLENGSVEKIVGFAHCPYKPWSEQAEGLFHFCMKRLRTLNFFSKLKFKNQKPIAVDDFFQAYPMIPLSC
jgi:hypothetical protein